MNEENTPIPGDLTPVDMSERCASEPPANTPQPELIGDLVGQDDPAALNGVWDLPAGTLVTLDATAGIVDLVSGTVTIFTCDHPMVFDVKEDDDKYAEAPAGTGVQLVAGTTLTFFLAIAESGGKVRILADLDSRLDISLLNPPLTAAVCGTSTCWGLNDRTVTPVGGIELCILNKCWGK